MRIYDNDNDDESWTPQSCNYDAIDDFINILFYLLKKRARRLRFHIVWFLVWEVQKVFFFPSLVIQVHFGCSICGKLSVLKYRLIPLLFKSCTC